MTHSHPQTIAFLKGKARHHGGANKSFVALFDQMDTEVIKGMGATAAWAELRAKRREMKRQGVK